ncbi:MAG: hypothetical protein PHX18_01135 [Candidatus Gastranaerophilales bacterium]|nr:hypothetical protein [Candidatus Gastranaerophilales bacterium]
MQVNFFKPYNVSQLSAKKQENTAAVNNTSFGSITRIVTTPAGEMLYRNNSNFFRCDLDWSKAADYIIQKFPDGTKIRSFACSDGSEPYSLAMILIDRLGLNQAKKYFPIMANDVDNDMIAKAKKGILFIDYIDIILSLKNLKNLTMGDFFKKSVEVNKASRKSGYFELRDVVKDTVQFARADALAVAQNNPIPSIVLARNFLPYLPQAKRSALIETIASKMPKNGLLSLGRYDFNGDACSAYSSQYLTTCLKANNFKELNNLYNTFTKIG